MASIIRRITENWKLKVLASSLAILLWVVVSAEQVTSNWIWVPLEVQVTDNAFQAQPSEVRDVQVRFTGPGRDLLDLAVRRPPLRLTIGTVEDENGLYSLEPRMVQIPGQLSVSALDVRPATVQLSFTRIDRRTIPVRIRTSQQLGDEWAIVDTLRAEPDRIEVSGPAARLAGLDEIATFVVDIAPGDSVFERVVPLDTTGFQGLRLSARRVTVSGAVDRVVERTLADIPVDVGPGITISPTRVAVGIRGAAGAVQAIVPETFRVVISINEIPSRIPSGGVLVPLRVDRMRPGVEASTIPAQVRLFPSQAVLLGQPIEEDTAEAEPEPEVEPVTEPDGE